MQNSHPDIEKIKSEVDRKMSEMRKNVKDQVVAEKEVKRFDHHLIDEDLELEDKNGRRLIPDENQATGVNGQSSKENFYESKK